MVPADLAEFGHVFYEESDAVVEHILAQVATHVLVHVRTPQDVLVVPYLWRHALPCQSLADNVVPQDLQEGHRAPSETVLSGTSQGHVRNGTVQARVRAVDAVKDAEHEEGVQKRLPQPQEMVLERRGQIGERDEGLVQEPNEIGFRVVPPRCPVGLVDHRTLKDEALLLRGTRVEGGLHDLVRGRGLPPRQGLELVVNLLQAPQNDLREVSRGLLVLHVLPERDELLDLHPNSVDGLDGETRGQDLLEELHDLLLVHFLHRGAIPSGTTARFRLCLGVRVEDHACILLPRSSFAAKLPSLPWGWRSLSESPRFFPSLFDQPRTWVLDERN